MLEDEAFDLLARHDLRQYFVVFCLAGLHRRFDEFLSHEQVFFADFDPYVFKVFIGANGHVGRNRPRCRRPNQGEYLIRIGTLRHVAIQVNSLEFYIDGEGFVVLVFDFSFSQGRFAVRAPVNGFEAFVNIALLGHFAEYADLSHFDLLMKRQVGMIPIAENAEADEVLLLFFYAFQGIIAAFRPQIEGRHFMAVQARILNDGVFNRQAVRIPAGNILRIIALLRLIF